MSRIGRWWWLAMAGLLAVALGGCADVVAPPLRGSKPEVLLSGTHGFWWPDLSGHTIVWMDDRDSPQSPLRNPDVYAFDLTSHEELSICTDPSRQLYPRVSGDIIVWTDYRHVPPAQARSQSADPDIYGYDLSARREFPICRAKGAQTECDVGGDVVVWTDKRARKGPSGADIYGCDLTTGREFPICRAPGEQSRPAVSGDLVVWEDYRRASRAEVKKGIAVPDIFAKRLSDGRTWRVSGHGGGGWGPQTDGRWVVWQHEHASEVIALVAQDTESPRNASMSTKSLWHGSLSDGVLIWIDQRSLTDPGDSDVLGLDLSGDETSEFTVWGHASAAFPVADHGRAAWESVQYDAASERTIKHLVMSTIGPPSE